ncbi:CYTH domain-containing protein [Bacillus sp. 31A1R]|uniref:CYTH domain-containing protein n=1 Tax=Robertmurraya mangrovi TaxID=3098077 RepID=A0ABU5IT86_9BACI|nr:CYTH domain-containing protein [Bacillus sp. 31A1R]MDZ5470363.1 CYTH domain-containing protein [Bacillus sp. 31A1R]
MSQQIEIEFKNLLTKEEFNRLKAYFHIEDSMFRKQVNHYFDTPTFILKDNKCALRIREKNDTFEMTLKEPLNEGILETNQVISKEEAEAMISNGTLVDGPIKSQLMKIDLDFSGLTYFGTLTTERVEFEYKDGLLVLDYSYYLNQHDYELEYEVNQYDLGQEIYVKLLQDQNIPIRKTLNKVRRFYEAKYKQL